MPDRARRPDPDELSRALTDLAGQLAYPATPDLATGVRARLTVAPSRPASWRTRLSLGRTLALAAVLLVLLAGGLLAVFPEAWRAVAAGLGVPGITITHQPASEGAAPGSSVGAVPSPATGSALTTQSLGEPLASVDAARAAVRYSVLVPTAPELGTPDGVYLAPRPDSGQVTLVYRARPGLPEAPGAGLALLFSQFEGRLEPALSGKSLGPGSRLEQVTLDGRPAYWISGEPHQFYYRDRSSAVIAEEVRLAGNVLLWEQAGLTLRLEGAPTREQALRIAASVR